MKVNNTSVRCAVLVFSVLVPDNKNCGLETWRPTTF